jgi:DNA-binding CsgD family transcriptional regulator
LIKAKIKNFICIFFINTPSYFRNFTLYKYNDIYVEMSTHKKGSKLRSENIASNTGPSPMEELFSSTPCVQFLLESCPFWEPIRLKFLCSNPKLGEITGYTLDEMLVPGFDFLKLIISENYQEPMLNWLGTMNEDRNHPPYKLIFTLITPNGPSDFIIADGRKLPSSIFDRVVRYSISGIIFGDNVQPFESVEECYRQIARRKYQDIYNCLSAFDLKILGLLAKGEPSKNIFREVCMSESTFDHYRTYMETKFKVKNCTEMIAKAIRMGII